jgi:neutral ceramidase
MRAGRVARGLSICVLFTVAGCGGGGGGPDAAVDGPPTNGITTEHCEYLPMAATANAGGTVTAGALAAGAAEVVLDVPVGTALGGYTARAGFLGTAGIVDSRKNQLSGSFNPTIGVFTAPRAKALALAAGGETIVIVKLDAIFVYEGMLFDLEDRLGDAFHGKVLLASSHTHSGWAQHSGHSALKVGGGELRDVVYERVLGGAEDAARAALAALRPARIGIHADLDFDPTDQISRDRRGDNDALMGGSRKDDHLYLIRVDGTDDVPIAAVAVFGEHGTLNGEDNPLASNDAPGAVERQLQLRLPPGTIAIHLQSAGGDVSPTPHGGIDCDLRPGEKDDPCFGGWTAEEGHGEVAGPVLYDAWVAAADAMQSSIALEMLSRSVELGPYPETFTVRGGELAYAPFDLSREPDGVVMNGAQLASPVDEYNAPVGVALCETPTPMFPAAAIPGTEGILPYGSCMRVDVLGEILGPIFGFAFESDETHPICQTTRTTISALKLGDYVIGTLPGEVSVMIADAVRASSPVDGDHTMVIGYAQGHVGYILTPEDWVLGGYEASVSFDGPLEGQYLVEKLAALLPLATTAEREDGTTGGTTRLATARMTDDMEIDDPAPNAGTVPATVPEDTWVRSGTPATAQPAAQIPRLEGVATFVWIGDDPIVKTPVVTLQRDVGGTWTTVTRANGSVITDGEIVRTYTPQPLRRIAGEAQTHLWAVEYQLVPAWGAVDLGAGANGALAGFPLGDYRFHVEGNGWTLDSAAFEVVPGGLYASATRVATTGANVRVSLDAPEGYRALDLALPSNRVVPLRQEAVTVRFKNAVGVVVGTATGTTDGGGMVSVDGGAGAATATQVDVEDSRGNVVNAPLT